MPGYDRRSRSRSPARRDGGRFDERRDDRGYDRRDDRGGYGGGRNYGGRDGGNRENRFGKPTVEGAKLDIQTNKFEEYSISNFVIFLELSTIFTKFLTFLKFQ